MTGHGPVSYGSRKNHCARYVIERPVLARLAHGQAHEDEAGQGHDGADSKVPVRAVCGQGNLGRLSIDGVARVVEDQRIIAAFEGVHRGKKASDMF